MPPLMSSSRDPTARLRAGLNPLLTASLGVYHGHNSNSTPLSAFSTSSHGAFSSAQTPVSAIQPYNPQEWLASPIAAPGADRMQQHQQHQHQHQQHPLHQQAQSYHEPQPSPPPPPPYSPPRSGGGRPMSMAFEQVQAANVSAARAPPPPMPMTRAAPEAPAANTNFPPPPGARGPSRERRFGLPSLSRRREPEPISPPMEPQPQQPRPHSLLSWGQSSQPGPSHPGPLTLQIPPAPQRTDSDPSQYMAPGARRAASTPAIATPTSARSRSSSQVRWGPQMQMAVPPPPPGPPPSAGRSQSVQRPSYGSDPVVSPPTRRAPPSGGTALGPVPPTPANWQDGDAMSLPQPQQESPSNRASSGTETASVGSSSAHAESSASSAGSAKARRDKTLLERRNASRTRGSVRNSIDGNIDAQGLDIVIPSGPTGLQRRLTINRGGTPRAGRAGDTPRTGESFETSHESRGSTPRASGTQGNSGQLTPTRLSPQAHGKQPEVYSVLAPKALPTPPAGSRSSSGSQAGMATDGLVSGALSPRPPSKQSVISQTTEQFSHATIERFTAFAHRESAAINDAERVRLFAEFFVSESRIRRERYGAAIGAMGSEVLDLTRDLFRPMAVRRESTNSAASGPVELTPQSSEPRSHRGSIGSAFAGTPGPHSQGTTPTSSSQPMSPIGGTPSNPNWQHSNYMPSLSPILSMSVSDVVDEEDSRGRPASRWWEADSSDANSTKMERSKRESKYMGVPKEAREALQWVDEPYASPAAGPSNYDSGEYPNEKTGWHDQDQINTPSHLRNSIISVSTPTAPSPNTPNPEHLDVSRLVTLPPPYPRHHPAVNNNHPELTEIRNSVRTISEMTEIDAIKEHFKQGSAKIRAEAAETAKQRRQALRQNLHQEIQSGSIGYAEAAAIEADATAEEHNKVKELEKKDFDDFQTLVVVPVNEILQSRITKATELFDNLRSRLFDETRGSNPNLPQEEGDEEPELLEKLTLLKWIFEARESLHRALYDLLSDRNDRYRDIVLVPYKLANQDDKVESAKAFFAEDASKRAVAFTEEVLQRTQEFRDVIEETVVRGVEVQLSAFWDIAPPLKRVLDQIPADMEGFYVQIPPSELDENPSYLDHPLQYLFSLLLHAEKSTYQFIESQTNLLCLLHEVKEAVVSAKVKVMEKEGRDPARVETMRAEERKRLTDDLQEKVKVVQDQWTSALGETIGGVKERAGGWLLETGGWDESLEDGGVGGV
ncbi:hypothetical protein B0T19DRAFT_458184 [Cercophora scortea]|uniref:Uncharacterized protein n=1 Tax=Cercophora scortea TaxID=314031 RepID=A0AAE0IXI7_9PEZI|nr:hypothetical protein B0T19DRAFT_458184 [Cercophora scortea]